jgi:hypothetical protein
MIPCPNSTSEASTLASQFARQPAPSLWKFGDY